MLPDLPVLLSNSQGEFMSQNNVPGFVAAIGNTPLIRLKAVSELTGCDIYGKAEFMNPGGSVKDRAAKAIIEDAEARGLIGPGGIIVEGTAGNTGIGLTMVGNAKGYKSVIVMPETQSEEKKDVLRVCGADLRLVPAAPYKNPNNYVRYSEALAKELASTHNGGVIWANQFDNTANMKGHYQTTGPEIWNQTNGQINGFICAVGSGGTLAGVGQFLKEQNKDVKIGQTAFAIGHPEGLVWTFTNGMISQKRPEHNWSYKSSRHKAKTIQIQVPINPGNSGGPLFNKDQKIWGDSILKITFEPYAWNMPVGIGCTLRLVYCQIDELVEGSENKTLPPLNEAHY